MWLHSDQWHSRIRKRNEANTCKVKFNNNLQVISQELRSHMPTLWCALHILIHVQPHICYNNYYSRCEWPVTCLFKTDCLIFVHYSLTAPDVTAAMLMERTIEKKSFRNLTIIMQTLSYIFLLFWHQHGHLITWVQSKNVMWLLRSWPITCRIRIKLHLTGQPCLINVLILTYREDTCLQTAFVIQMCQPQEKKTLCFESQWGSGWQINDNRWSQRYLPCQTETSSPLNNLRVHSLYEVQNDLVRWAESSFLSQKVQSLSKKIESLQQFV